MPDEQEITEADVKKQFEELSNNEQAEATEESSTTETEVADKPAEGVKTETAETADDTVETEPEPKVIPYSRFKEVNDKVKQFEELEKEAGQFIERGPDGKLRIKVVEKSEPEDDGLKLTEEEQLALDSVQTSVVSKLVQRELQVRERQAENTRVYREESSKWWNRAKEEFPDVGKPDSEFYKRADKIFKEQYVTFGKNKGEWTAPPNAHYLACLQAEKELNRDKVRKEQVLIQEKKLNKQTNFVSKKSETAPDKVRVKPKDMESLSASEQEQALRDEWNEIHKDEE